MPRFAYRNLDTNTQYSRRDGGYERSNEHRADDAEQALRTTDCNYSNYPDDDVVQGAFTDVSDLIGNLAHFCARAGIDVRAVIEHGLNAAYGDLEDAPEAERDPIRFPTEAIDSTAEAFEVIGALVVSV